MHNFFNTILILLIGLTLWGCNSKTGDNKHSLKVNVLFHPVQGAKFYYTVTNEMNTELKVNAQKINISKKAEIGMIYEMLKDSAGNRELKVTYDKFHIVTKDKDGNTETWDAEKAEESEEQMDKVLNYIKGNSLLITVSPKGDVLNVTGTQQINDKIMSGLSTYSAGDRAKIQAQLSQLIGETFVKNNLQASFKLFPDSAIAVGSNWTRKAQPTGELTFDADNKFTLEGIADDVASVSAKAIIKNVHSSGADMFGTGAQVDISGEQTGNFETNVKTGMLLSGKTETTLDGVVNVMNHSVPISIKTNKKISAKKME